MADEETTASTASPNETSADTVAVAEAAPIADAAATQDAGDIPATDATASQDADDALAAATAADENVSSILDEIRDLGGDAGAGNDMMSSFGDAPAEPFCLTPQVSDELQRILRLSVPVIVKLADKQLPLGEIIDLSPGSIVEFTRSADTPLELLVNNKVIGSGVAVKVGEKFGLRIDEICPIQETIRRLGP